MYTFKNFPVEEKNRHKTDCCCTIVSALFALTLFILSFVFYHRGISGLTQRTITRPTTPPMTRVKPAATIYLHNPIFISRTLMTFHQAGIVYLVVQTPASLSSAHKIMFRNALLLGAVSIALRGSLTDWEPSVWPKIKQWRITCGVTLNYQSKIRS